VKPYFPLPKVLAGLFKIVETLFNVVIRPDQAPVWHPGVFFYRIESQPDTTGDTTRAQSDRAVLPGPGCAQRQTGRRLDG
jgi:hypothetical protein